MKRPRVVFLDWDGTLSVSRFWQQWDDPSHERHEAYQAIQRELFRNRPQVVTDWMRGQLKLQDCLNLVVEYTGLSREELEQELEESCRKMQYVSPVVPELINQLRCSGMKVVVATDNMDAFTRWTVPALGLNELCDDVLVSHSVRALKRDRALSGESLFFGPYLEQHGILPSEALLIDDSKSNELADYGLQFHRIERGAGLVPVLKELVAA